MCFFGPLKEMEEMLEGLEGLQKQVNAVAQGTSRV